MALVECPECGRQVSELAVSCPGCGYPLRRRRRWLQNAEDVATAKERLGILTSRTRAAALSAWKALLDQQRSANRARRARLAQRQAERTKRIAAHRADQLDRIKRSHQQASNGRDEDEGGYALNLLSHYRTSRAKVSGGREAVASDDFEMHELIQRAARLTSQANRDGELGNLERAIDRFAQALEVNPAHLPAHSGIARAFLLKREYEAALDWTALARDIAAAMDTEQPIDWAFELAYFEVEIHNVRFQAEPSEGRKRELLDAVERALELGRCDRPAVEYQDVLADAAGLDLVAEKRSRMAVLEGLRAEL